MEIWEYLFNKNHLAFGGENWYYTSHTADRLVGALELGLETLTSVDEHPSLC
jgi:hypothetical protein